MRRPTFLRPLAMLRDQRGAGAVEFALIAPFLFLLCIGGPEITMALMLSKKINHAASAVGDLVTREAQMPVEELDAILSASRAFVEPYSAVPYTVRVTGLRLGAGGQGTVVWSRANGLEPRRPGEEVPLDRASTADTGIVMVETSYAFRPISGFLAETPYELSRVALNVARAGDEVTCLGC